MIMELYSEEEAAKPKRFWKLEDFQGESENLKLVICDENGNRVSRGTILTINKKTGHADRHLGICQELGLDLDVHHRVNIS
jgi:hypothetical protein